MSTDCTTLYTYGLLRQKQTWSISNEINKCIKYLYYLHTYNDEHAHICTYTLAASNVHIQTCDIYTVLLLRSQALLPAAGLLQLTEVRRACCEFLSSQLHPSNCLGIRAFADLHACCQLLTQANTYAGRCVCVFTELENI